MHSIAAVVALCPNGHVCWCDCLCLGWPLCLCPLTLYIASFPLGSLARVDARRRLSLVRRGASNKSNLSHLSLQLSFTFRVVSSPFHGGLCSLATRSFTISTRCNIFHLHTHSLVALWLIFSPITVLFLVRLCTQFFSHRIANTNCLYGIEQYSMIQWVIVQIEKYTNEELMHN